MSACSRIAVVLVALLAGAGVARADDAAMEQLAKRPRATFLVGMGGGVEGIGGAAWGGGALDLGVAWRVGRTSHLELIGDVLLARLSHTRDDHTGDVHATLETYGALARWTFYDHKIDFSASTQVWLDGGVGLARYQYDEGGTLGRREMFVGMGANLLGFLRGELGKKNFPGFTMGVRVIIADAPPPYAAGGVVLARSTGGGMPSPSPSGDPDFGLLATFGFTWGL